LEALQKLELKRFIAEEMTAMTREAKAQTPEERRDLARSATTGLRVRVRVTRDMYSPR
jgi:hypothetical protein